MTGADTRQTTIESTPTADGRHKQRPRKRPPWIKRFFASAVRGWLATLVLTVLILLMWEVAAGNNWINQDFTGRPSGVWAALVEFYESGRLLTQTWATLEATLIAFVVGTFAGTLGGFVLGIYPAIDRIIGPLLVPLNSVPRIALAPLFILWFGLTMSAKVVLAISIVFFMVLFNARASVKSVEPDLMVMARVAGFSRMQIISKVVFPSAVPMLFAGVRLAITYAFLGVIASEMIAAKDGLGQDIVYFSGRLQVDGIWATLLVLAVVATLINLAFEQLERWLLRWQQ